MRNQGKEKSAPRVRLARQSDIELAWLCEKGEDDAAYALLNERPFSAHSCRLALRAIGRSGFESQKTAQRLLTDTRLEAEELVELLCAAARKEECRAWIHRIMHKASAQNMTLEEIGNTAMLIGRQESPLCVAAASGTQACLQALLLYHPGQTQLDGAMSLAINHQQWSTFFLLLQAGANAQSHCAQGALAFCEDQMHRQQALICLHQAGVPWEALLVQLIDLRCVQSMDECIQRLREEGPINWNAPWRAYWSQVLAHTRRRDFVENSLRLLAREEQLELMAVFEEKHEQSPTEDSEEDGQAGKGRRALRI